MKNQNNSNVGCVVLLFFKFNFSLDIQMIYLIKIELEQNLPLYPDIYWCIIFIKNRTQKFLYAPLTLIMLSITKIVFI